MTKADLQKEFSLELKVTSSLQEGPAAIVCTSSKIIVFYEDIREATRDIDVFEKYGCGPDCAGSHHLVVG